MNRFSSIVVNMYNKNYYFMYFIISLNKLHWCTYVLFTLTLSRSWLTPGHAYEIVSFYSNYLL